MKRATLLDGHADKEMERVTPESDLDQTLSLWLPRTTMRDFASCGRKFSSRFIVNTHIAGMAQGAPFSRRARYLPKVDL